MDTIDCLGEMCPLPSMRLQKQLREAKPGDSFLLVTDHSCVPRSIGEYCSKKGLLFAQDEVMSGVWELRITVPDPP